MFRTIVVGTDGSETATKAVEGAADLAGAHGAALAIVSAYGPPPGGAVRPEAQQVPGLRQWAKTAGEVDEVLRRAGAVARDAGVQAETYARQGDPADAILDVAEELHADLVVVGHKGMTGAKRVLLGSVPTKVSHHAPCSVLIIRTS
jgi:nucleotide-binding universal stress UspA family protein